MCSRPEEAAAEAEAERRRRLGLVEERGVVQPQLLQRLAQLRILVALDRVEPGEDHRLQLLEAGKRLGGGPRHLGDGVAELRVGHALDVRDDEADLADAELGRPGWPWAKTRRGCPPRSPAPSAISRIFIFGRSTPSITRTTITTPRYGSYHESKISAFSGASGSPVGRWKRRDDGLEDVVGAGALLGAGQDGGAAVEADDVLDLTLALVGLRAGQVDLVDDRDDLEVVVHGQVGVGQRLGLDALRGVDQQQRALRTPPATA